MNFVEDTCRSLESGVDGCLACGVVDLDAGVIVSLSARGKDSEVFRASFLANATELFTIPSQELLGIGDGPAKGTFTEVQLTTERARHFGKSFSKSKLALVVVTTKEASAGLSWAQLKEAAARLDGYYSAA
jgi:hypothetical protein